MSRRPGAVTAGDVEAVVGATITALADRLGRDWHAPTGTLEWDCWETVEHISDGLFFYATQLVPVPASITKPAAHAAVSGWGYPFDYREKRAGGPEGIMFARPDEGPAGLGATGRGELPGRARLGAEEWRWFGAPR